MLPMALAFPPRIDRRGLALAQARFRAWWDGVAFDEAAALAALEAAAAASPVAEGADLFGEDAYTYPPRLEALQLIWGRGRLLPGSDQADSDLLALLTVPADGTLAVLGPGADHPVRAFAASHPGPLAIFEWREEATEALRQTLGKDGLDARCAISAMDVETVLLPAQGFDGIVSLDEFSVCASPSRLATQITKALRPGAEAVIEAYVGTPPQGEIAAAFAAAFCEPQIRPILDLERCFDDAGLFVLDASDQTQAHLDLAIDGFRRLEGQISKLTEAGDADPLRTAAIMRELAWETDAWRVRIKLLHRGHLVRRRWWVKRDEV